MRYIRTEDGRIVEEHNLESGFKQTIITVKNKKDNKELTQIVCDDLDDYLEMVVVGEYCKCHKINPKDIKYEATTLFNKILKQSDTIEELCDGLIVEQKDKPNIWFTMEVQEFINEKEHLKDWFYKAFIKTDKGLIYVAEMNDKGELELL